MRYEEFACVSAWFNTIRRVMGWLERLRAWIHQHTEPPGESAADTPATDAEVISAWEPLTHVTVHSWRTNPLLDLPLKP
jgi:hypothetical protein